MGRGTAGKTTVFGMRERDGRTKALPISNTKTETFEKTIFQNIKKGSVL